MKEGLFFVKDIPAALVRYWYETAHYMLDSRELPSIWKEFYEIESTLEPLEKARIPHKKDASIEDDTFEYFLNYGFLAVRRIENRLKDNPQDDYNRKALLLLKKADILYGIGISAPQNRFSKELSGDKMAYGICKTILEMQDDGIDLWPGIIHQTIIFIMLRYPKFDFDIMSNEHQFESEKRIYEEMYALLERGMKNAEFMEEEARKNILYAFSVAVKKFKLFPHAPEPSIL